MSTAETCGSVREDNMVVAIGAVTEPAETCGSVIEDNMEEDILVRAKPMTAGARGLRRRHA
jgi:hypothetical protein